METRLEHVLTHFYKEEMIRHLAEHSEDFEEAILLAVSNKQPYSWRAAWLLWSCMEKDDVRLKGSIKTIIDVIPTLKDGHQRELLKILQMMELNEEEEGLIFNLCMNVWEQIHKVPSVRWHAFMTLLKIAKNYPELLNEIKLLAQEHYMDSLSPGIKHTLGLRIKELNVH